MPPDVYHVRRPTIPRSPGFFLPKNKGYFFRAFRIERKTPVNDTRSTTRNVIPKGRSCLSAICPLSTLLPKYASRQSITPQMVQKTPIARHTFFSSYFARSFLDNVPNPAMSQLPFPPYKKPLMMKNSAANSKIQTTAIIQNTSQYDQSKKGQSGKFPLRNHWILFSSIS